MTVVLLLTATGLWAADNVTIVTNGSGTATSAISNSVCTLTVTPAAGEYATADNITAVKIVSGNIAQAPRRSPGIDNTAIAVTATNPDADPSGVTTYTFDMPGDGYDVEVTVDFQTLQAITPTVTLEGWAYGSDANTPEVEGNPGNGEVYFTYAAKGSTDFTGDVPTEVGTYVVKATISASGMYSAGEATAEFAISKATPTLTVAEELISLNLSEASSTVTNAVTVLFDGEEVDGDFSFTFASSDNSVVRIENGVQLKAEGVGEATITVTGPKGHGTFNEAETTFTVNVYTNYNLSVAGEQVTSINDGNILGNDYEGTASFDAASNTLTISGINWAGGSSFVESGLDNLTVVLAGDNTISNESNPLFASTVSTAVLTFKESAAAAGTLHMNSMSETFAYGFAETIYEDGLNMQILSREEYNNQFFISKTAFGYGISLFTTADESISVTAENMNDVFGNGTVSFDGQQTLTLSGAELNKIVVDGSQFASGLTIFLKGDNIVRNSSGITAIAAENTTIPTLTITTNANEAGRFVYYNESLSLTTAKDCFSGFTSVVYKGGLVEDLSTITDENETVTAKVMTVFSPMQPVVVETTDNATEEDAGTVIDYSDEDNEVTTETLVNTIIDGILYTLEDTQTAGAADDGFVDVFTDEEGNKNSIVVLNSEMTDTDVQSLIAADDKQPGTDAYAEAFKGLTFKLPKGEGNIFIKNAITDDSHEIHVVIGSTLVTTIKTNGIYVETTTIPYDVDADTYVYIYTIAVSGSAPALAMSKGPRRIGPKAGVSSGMGGITISASSISVPPAAATTLTALLADSYTAGNAIVVKDLKVSSLADNAFADASPLLNYIDLSATTISGVTVSRSSGAFAGVDPNTFIYLPSGNNDGGEPNVVIGSNCADMQLSDAHSFQAAKLFTAAKAKLNRAFTADKRSTVYLPFAMPQAEADALGTFYQFVSIEGTTVNMTKVTTGLQANTPYIFVPAAAAATGISANNVIVRTAALSGASFRGTYSQIMWAADQSSVYCFVGEAKDGFEIGMFARMGAGSWVPPFRAYMVSEAATAPTLDINFIDAEATAIETVESDRKATATDVWFTVNGMRIVGTPAKKGLYIHNGKKTIVK